MIDGTSWRTQGFTIIFALGICLCEVAAVAQQAENVPRQSTSVEEFLQTGEKFVTSLSEIADALEKGSSAYSYEIPEQKRPWSGHFWRGTEGFLLKRYLPAELSPADKHDALAGDHGLSEYLTASIVEMKKHGPIPAWYGLCDGWSIASNLVPRPLYSVESTTNQGKSLRISPSEIKGLAAMLFATSFSPDLNLLIRTYRPMSAVDLVNMLILRLKIQEKPLIMDVASGPEVWNHNVLGYKFKLSPITGSRGKASQLVITLKYLRSRAPTPETFFASDTPNEDATAIKEILIRLEKDDKNGPFLRASASQMPDAFWTIDDRLLALKSYFQDPQVTSGGLSFQNPVRMDVLKSLVIRSQSRESSRLSNIRILPPFFN